MCRRTSLRSLERAFPQTMHQNDECGTKACRLMEVNRKIGELMTVITPSDLHVNLASTTSIYANFFYRVHFFTYQRTVFQKNYIFLPCHCLINLYSVPLGPLFSNTIKTQPI